MSLILQDGKVPKPDFDLIASVYNEAMTRAGSRDGHLLINTYSSNGQPYYFTSYVNFRGPGSVVYHGFKGPVEECGGYNEKPLLDPNERNATVNVISQKIIQHPQQP